MAQAQDTPLTPDRPIVLLSGMGADARIFEPQLSAFPSLSVPAWMSPKPGESLPRYAERFAAQLKEKFGEQPIYLGGMSFGGMVALEMLHHLNVRRCFLISTIRSAKELPPHLRAMGAVGKRSSYTGAWMTVRMASLGLKLVGPRLRVDQRAYFEQVAGSDPGFLRWAVRAMYSWPVPRPPPTPVHHIHGSADPVLPARHTQPDDLVDGAGHVLTLSHPERVNAFIERYLREDAAEDG